MPTSLLLRIGVELKLVSSKLDLQYEQHYHASTSTTNYRRERP
jgi:hypothetical protein